MSESIIILIADDDPDDREMFIECAKSVNPHIKCIEAGDGERALQILDSESDPLPDFIFLDLNMPRLNGEMCLSAIKKNAKLSDIPVIIYTTSALNDSIRLLKADHFLTKPYTFKEVCKAINFVLQKFGVKTTNEY